MDPSQPESFRSDPLWQKLDDTISIFQIDPDAENVIGFSFSGNERNRLFIRRSGNYEDMSLVSGVDFKEDGRGFAIIDYDNDGALDLGVTSTQNPRFRIAKNSFTNSISESMGKFVKIRLTGGNTNALPNLALSPRDPIGARLVAKIGKQTQMFQLSIGEGFSVQNSNWIHIGLGKHEKIDQLEVWWPSGKKTIKRDIPSGARIQIVEIED